MEGTSKTKSKTDDTTEKMDSTPSSSRSINFWNILESKENVVVPIYVKNIFKMANLDNHTAFKCVTEEALKELEIYVRESMKDILDEDENLQDYYGPYYKKPEKFSFAMCDKFVIKKLVLFAQSSGDELWNLKTAPEKTKINEQSTSTTNSKEKSLPNITPKLDITEERKNLLKAVKTAVEKSILMDAETKEKKNVLDKIEVTISVAEIYESGDLPKSYTYNAKIKCPCCLEVSKFKKCGDVDTKGSRWVISNFKRH